MAASIQERLKLKQYQVDTWTTREQLCLASAVMRSGDQNWVAVRRNIKMLTNETSRPPDWYSTKNCALQYARLLERVDTPKRKRERGDGGNETPGEIVTKMLSKQRVEELRALEAEEKASYIQLRKEIQQLESGKLDNQLDAFWEQLVKEHAEEEEEEQRQQQWLKEREEKITAIQQALKHQGPKVPQPPHKKKPKLQVGGCGSVAESRRSSGLSETSSEVDSAVESPDQNEVTSESLSQDESGAGESEARPTPTSPLLSSLLSKSSPITGVPGAASSPLTQLGNRTMRAIGISPVSEALQNLVSSAISGTNTSDKDKSTPTASSSGTSTLSLLLDLPPSTPGCPLPRLNDLPGPSYESREQEEKKSDPTSKSEKKEESCSDNKGCAEQVKVEEIKPAEPIKPTESTAITPGDGESAEATLEGQKDTHMEEKRKEATVTSGESIKEEEKDSSVSQTATQKLDEASDSKKELKTSHNEEKEKEQKQEQGSEGKIDQKEEEKQKKEVREEQEQDQSNKEESSRKLQEKETEVKEEKDSKNERLEGKKIRESGIEENKIKTEEKSKETDCSSEEKSEEHKTEVTSSKTSENVAKVATSSAEVEEKDLNTTCTPEEGNKCTGEEAGCEKNQEKTVKKEENIEMGEKEEEEVEEEEKEEEENEETTRAEAKEEKERDNKTENKEEEAQPSKKSTDEEEEEEPPAKVIKTEENALNSEGEKKPKKIVIKKEQEEDPLESQDSKDWVSEEEGSTFGSRKRKISGGENIGSSSPLISESTPNSPASTHYGDDSENERAYKSWKKPIMILWNDIAAHKFASLFLRPITDDQAPGYHSIVYRPMDLQRIKRNIESGAIRTTAEFQRDIMLMFLNATMYNTRDHNVYHMAHHMMKDAVSTIQDFLTTQMLVRAEETPQKSLRRETRESSAKRSDDDSKRKRDPLDEKSLKKRRTN
ncbi:bromodomain-containing protein 8-like isoform X2 [Portunus trituberculatus]|uniref:bromodomain-containing protein 8-like isoform X2 n=1 Tax=Portunus trituberculatus TaxID=210409 RepID=UPI001E1D0D83|nr:bromodomain-containing protein 8-like isoform X2 [Portunus trituberculatus]